MSKFLKYTFFFFIFSIPGSIEAANVTLSTDSVVKIFVTSNSVDYYRPWQDKGMSSFGGSGAIIKGNKILTNAHVVADNTFIQVKKEADPKKYTAKVEAIAYDCDLALLSVNDPDFFEGTHSLELGGLPNLQDNVMVIGYPQGGDKISITEGVVSRVEVTSYSQSSRQLLTVQIDAAINPGNSGGPVVQDGNLVGIAMQILQSSQSIGYMIPVPIIKHFFTDLKDGKYDGFPLIGIEFNNTENTALRDYFNIQQETGGILVSNILPFSPAYGQLKRGDIVLSLNGIAIGEDGTFQFRGKERLTLPYLITQKQIGGELQLKVMRNGKVENILVTLKPFESLVPPPHYFKEPPYYIYGGMVFTVLSTDLLSSWGKRWWEKAPLNFKDYLMGKGRSNNKGLKEVVVLLNVLPDDINVGYHRFGNDVVTKVNGKEFKSFKEFVILLSKVKDESKYTIIETERRKEIIVNNANIDQVNNEILKRNNIPSQFSKDVEEWSKNN